MVDIRFCAPLKRALSLGVSPTSMILAPARSCMMRPEVTMGEMPNSIRVPEEGATVRKTHQEKIQKHTERNYRFTIQLE